MIIKQGKKVTLRNTVPEDCLLIEQAEIHPDNSPFVGHWSFNDHIDSLNDPDHLRITLLDTDGVFCGFVILRGMSSYSENIEIKRIVVTRKGEGIGRETLELLISLAFGKYNTRHVFLGTKPENKRAIHLYTSVGFIPEADKPTSFHMYTDDYRERTKHE
jgi:diamine N-acetyltransferase